MQLTLTQKETSTFEKMKKWVLLALVTDEGHLRLSVVFMCELYIYQAQWAEPGSDGPLVLPLQVSIKLLLPHFHGEVGVSLQLRSSLFTTDIYSSYQGLHLSSVPGTKTAADFSDGACEPGLSPPSSCLNTMPVLHLVEDLRLALEMVALPQEREALLSQIPGPTAAYIKEWFEDGLVSWTRA